MKRAIAPLFKGGKVAILQTGILSHLRSNPNQTGNARAAVCNAYVQLIKEMGAIRRERSIKTLVVHHRNYTPEDNRAENLAALCSGCHMLFHTRRRGNISPGQLSLW